ncbi:hypothetical protein GGU10DRAFT_433068 [Lentinula aff. detonsa]|uniref:Fruit-body specific protein a n=1 Tax=Lentinula aff. detonsa TaxID=2804958 RepID=A0AA38NMR8_9AGAR|nr:hypothetical protein GGU10DRAFT_433068 [Lentinula aff. detonsa]
MLYIPLLLFSLASTSTAVYLPPLDTLDSTESIVALLSASNHHGAPHPPDHAGSIPGWYYGDDPVSADGLPWLKDNDLCAVLASTRHALRCPVIQRQPTKTYGKRSAEIAAPTQHSNFVAYDPTPSYYTVFSGLTGAINGPGYLTYGLVDTVDDCEAMCNSVSGCVFVNAYHDVNGKNGSPLLTCSLYSEVNGAEQATNYGGQLQPDGSYDYVTDSDGYALNS